MALNNMHSDLKSNASFGLCINIMLGESFEQLTTEFYSVQVFLDY